MGFKKKRLPKKEYRELCERVAERDEFRCRNPDCLTPTYGLSAHHIQYRSDGGEDTEENLILLCYADHEAEHRKYMKFSGTASNLKIEKLKSKIK